MSITISKVSKEACEKLGIEIDICLSVFKVENTQLEDYKYFKVYEDNEFVYALELFETSPAYDTLFKLVGSSHIQSIRRYFASESGRLYVRLDICGAEFRNCCDIARIDWEYLKEGETMYVGKFKYSDQSSIEMQFVTRLLHNGKYDFYLNLPDGNGLKFVKTISATQSSINVAIHQELNWYVKWAISTL